MLGVVVIPGTSSLGPLSGVQTLPAFSSLLTHVDTGDLGHHSHSLGVCLSWHTKPASLLLLNLLLPPALASSTSCVNSAAPVWLAYTDGLQSVQPTYWSEVITTSSKPVCHRPYLHGRPYPKHPKPQWSMQFDWAEVLLESWDPLQRPAANRRKLPLFY